jgi:hypothetical protein
MSNIFDKEKSKQELNNLTQQWIEAKNAENAAKEKRLAIEFDIISISGIDSSNPGSKVIDNGVRVSTKLNRKWDQDFLHNKARLITSLSDDVCPFKVEYKEDRKKMDALKLYKPDVYKELEEGLELKPAKPTFTVK